MQFGLAVATLALGWFIINGTYQVLRKPTELFFPVSGTLNKSPERTWQEYGSLFRKNSTPIITPYLLAALAQVEAAGNPIARTYWRWSWTPHLLQIYRPASSAVGMYQLTDSTFAEARRYCIRDHHVIEAGAWNDWHACWFNSLYLRIVPAHAVELTSAYLDRTILAILVRRHVYASQQREQALAAVIHLCGAGAADQFVRRGFRFSDEQYCGDQLARDYVARVDSSRQEFEQLAGRDRDD